MDEYVAKRGREIEAQTAAIEAIAAVLAEDEQRQDEEAFRTLLHAIEEADTNYAVRYTLVLDAVAMANHLGYATGFRLDPQAPAWPVAYIELPTGQVSWHLPQHPTPYDGHTTEEKYRRCR